MNEIQVEASADTLQVIKPNRLTHDRVKFFCPNQQSKIPQLKEIKKDKLDSMKEIDEPINESLNTNNQVELNIYRMVTNEPIALASSTPKPTESVVENIVEQSQSPQIIQLLEATSSSSENSLKRAEKSEEKNLLDHQLDYNSDDENKIAQNSKKNDDIMIKKKQSPFHISLNIKISLNK